MGLWTQQVDEERALYTWDSPRLQLLNLERIEKGWTKVEKVDSRRTYSKYWLVVLTIQYITGMSLVLGLTRSVALKRIYKSNYIISWSRIFFISSHSFPVQVIPLTQSISSFKSAWCTKCHSQFEKNDHLFLISYWTWMGGNLLCKLPKQTPISTHSYLQSPYSTSSFSFNHHTPSSWPLKAHF